eukprot:CAMPEP_0183292064 /NCGR_PEP_ID=MMETSP0160_2-20130417/1270_1 /TAXON_ID=2839 ORGANISM="Odontella Sinensis, Strain Grunow 1884" /NCGR_SAMPLE_ID=MMETSP0160_2 /ASSEMBLY_ACC=CAM_ASM_000250 /LENGTH=71 /DNA_ID=CAMNT_0025452971 /DNA_START=334 /DNA_END=549 /DNA_ORIENTATION=+
MSFDNDGDVVNGLQVLADAASIEQDQYDDKLSDLEQEERFNSNRLFTPSVRDYINHVWVEADAKINSFEEA